ncbi:hypothetical protein SISNIDRAFT_467488 [Sistotremastrum niveocremeum HHB9708]|uniref:Uncharacterized protein n=1 Tax=Sistotremastrum niveocremeum HHB9708 TaxID=1314777 RepID=A0A164SJK3_9AGAM|nr:hypothetical protein SISNIDRAFT_467488 [Sistotremastrum niveocremeum HHB9708]
MKHRNTMPPDETHLEDLVRDEALTRHSSGYAPTQHHNLVQHDVDTEIEVPPWVAYHVFYEVYEFTIEPVVPPTSTVSPKIDGRRSCVTIVVTVGNPLHPHDIMAAVAPFRLQLNLEKINDYNHRTLKRRYHNTSPYEFSPYHAYADIKGEGHLLCWMRRKEWGAMECKEWDEEELGEMLQDESVHQRPSLCGQIDSAAFIGGTVTG